MLYHLFKPTRLLAPRNHRLHPVFKTFACPYSSDEKDGRLLKSDLSITGVNLDEIDEIMSDEALKPLDTYYPNTLIAPSRANLRAHGGCNVMVIQPWLAYANFDEHTDPELQLEECVSLANTLPNWNVVGKKVVFSPYIRRKHLVGTKVLEELRDGMISKKEVNAAFFGVELLSAIQLATLEEELKIACYDRFTVVLNIFRKHAKTKEAKIQVALAELPYIRSHLREIHQSSEYSSSAESLKFLVGGIGETFYHRRLDILKRRESKLKYLLEQIRKQRDLTKKLRRKSDTPTVSVVGYTNSGKTSLIKYLTQDEKLQPLDRLFATLDVTAHTGQLPSSKSVYYLDTVGFVSRIPLLLFEAFSATLKDVHESDLILHILDVTHPDYRLQYSTVIKALESLKISKNLMDTRVTIGNKADKLNPDTPEKNLPKCDFKVSALTGLNMKDLLHKVDYQLIANLRHHKMKIRVENGGKKYSWIRKYASIVDCQPDETDANYLVCSVVMSPASVGRWNKQFGHADILERSGPESAG